MAPGVPNGTPAVMMIRSPGTANSCEKAIRHARSTISSISLASSETTQWQPHTMASRLAVSRTGESAMTGTDGRSRQARMPVEPEDV